MNSNFLSVNFKDFGKMLLVAVGSSVLQFLYELIQAKGLALTTADFSQMLNVGIVAALAYLMKNLFTNSEGQTFKGEN